MTSNEVTVLKHHALNVLTMAPSHVDARDKVALCEEVERLRAVNAQLLAALKHAAVWIEAEMGRGEHGLMTCEVVANARAAIEAAEAEE